MFCFVLLFSSSWSLFQRSIFFNVMYFILVYIMGNKMTKYATTNTNRQIQWNSQKNQQCKRISMIVKNFWPTNECHFYYHLLHGLSKYDVCLQFYSVRTGWNVIHWSDFWCLTWKAPKTTTAIKIHILQITFPSPPSPFHSIEMQRLCLLKCKLSGVCWTNDSYSIWFSVYFTNAFSFLQMCLERTGDR